MSRDPAPLAGLPAFAEAPGDALAHLASRLRPVTMAPGEALMSEGEPGTFFVLLATGSASVRRGGHELATAGPGAIVGELALLRGAPRAATVVAIEPVIALIGDADAFETLLDVPGVRERLARTIAQRLAQNTRPVRTSLRDGTALWIRPILPTDGEGLLEGLERLSPESRYQRFFTPVKASASLARYLSDIDYVDHFAWVAAADEGAAHPTGVASARYIRESADPTVAEIALEVVDDQQGKGLGRILVAALAAAAPTGGIERFRAFVQERNRAMRALLDTAGAEWHRAEPGVVETVVPVAGLVGGIDPDLSEALHEAAEVIVSAASLALA